MVSARQCSSPRSVAKSISARRGKPVLSSAVEGIEMGVLKQNLRSPLRCLPRQGEGIRSALSLRFFTSACQQFSKEYKGELYATSSFDNLTQTSEEHLMLAGHAVAQCLRNEGVRHVFCVPGESYVALLDGLCSIPEIQLITNRQEGGAGFMAEGYAKATRTTGVCLVTRGPGATNASIAIHSAKYDAVPLVLLVGQVGRGARGREAGQELDYTHFFGSIAKWVVEINDPKHIPRVMTRAFHLARTGRPGPVVVSLPRDVLEEKADISMVDPYPMAWPSPDPKLIEEMVGRINSARKPMLLVGSGTQYSGGWQELIDFSEKFQIPVLTSYKRQDAFPNSHPNYIGNLSNANKHARAIVSDEADLVLVIGSRLNQQTTGAFSFPRPAQAFIQIDADEQNIGQNSRPAVGIVADAKQALIAALKHPGPRPDESRASWISELHSA